ncbi:MAG: molybdopterin-binding protein [Candidatus Scalinduaceae bacterium]
MNKLKGKIMNIESSEHISIVDIDVEGDLFSSIIIETPETADYLRIGEEVFMLFKETEVSIGKALSGNLSLRNRLTSKIKTIEKGKVLTKIVLDYSGKDIISVITTRSTNKLDLKVGDEVQGLVKANEVTIMK